MAPNSPKSSLNSQFKALRWQLLLSYLVVMVAIRLIADAVVYQLFANSLYQQIDQRLFNLAQAASHSLAEIKQNRKITTLPRHRPLDNDGDLDLPWQNLRTPDQGIEWFDVNRQRLAKAGTLVPHWDLSQKETSPQIRTLVLPVYSLSDADLLEGYVRASESTASIESLLHRLSWGLILGGGLAMGLIGISGMWLTGQALKPIEQSFWQLKQFTADASHELRSPLTVIKTSVEVMQTHSERFPTEDLPRLNAVISATKQMTQLVEDLLLLARSDRISQTPASFPPIPLSELLEDVVEFLEPEAQARQISLTLKIIHPITVNGDANSLLRLFSNLVENGLQYTPVGGKVMLTLKEDLKWAIILIEDSGIGIAIEDQPYIFTRLWRADKARWLRSNGSGLGLAIAQAIAQTHRGQIGVTSQLGVGSCFQVRLPKD